MHIAKNAQSTKLEGVFGLSENGKVSRDLRSLIDYVDTRVDFKHNIVAMVGFSEIDQKDIRKRLDEQNIRWERSSNGLLIVRVTSKEQLTLSFVEWAKYAGGAGLFGVVVGKEDASLDELVNEYLKKGNKPPDAKYILEDVSDGEKNQFVLLE